MTLVPVLLFVACLLLSAFFSSSETAFIASNPYTLEYLEKKGSRRAGAGPAHPGPDWTTS